MRFENLGFDTGQGRAGGMDLIKDIDAVTAVLHHLADAANLTGNPVQGGAD